MTEFHVDLLSIAGVNHEMFNDSGGDVRLEEDHKRVARVFRDGSSIVYRCGTRFEWDDEDGHPVS